MAATPEMSDIIVTVLAARRRASLENGTSAITLVGHPDDRRLREITAFAGRNRIPIRLLEPGDPELAADGRRPAASLPDDSTHVIFGEGEVLEHPTPALLAQRLGMGFEAGAARTYDVVIVGGGPAGIAAAVYAGAEGLCALVVEDLAIGGQAGTSSRIENYMGFPTGISGADLCWRGEIQAMKFGTRFAMPHRVTGIEPENGDWCLTLDSGARVLARSVIVATGVQYRRLPLPKLPEFEGAGIYYAATDVEARYCRDTEVVVIGGGNSAGQAAMFLCRTAKHVHLLVRGGSLAASMSSYLIERLQKDPAITIHYNTEVAALEGEDAAGRCGDPRPGGGRGLAAGRAGGLRDGGGRAEYRLARRAGEDGRQGLCPDRRCGGGGRAVCHLLPRHLRGGRRARGVGQAGGLGGGRGIGGDFRGRGGT